MNLNQIISKYTPQLKEDNYDAVFKDMRNTEDMQLLFNFMYQECGINPLEKMTFIPDNFFLGNDYLIFIHIPDSITNIGNNAFENCPVKEVSIPDSVTNIGNSVFKNCQNLNRVRLSRSMEKLPKDTFNGCRNLNQIFIPDSITSISAGVFDNCSANLIIVANFRTEDNDKIKFPGADVDFYKQHLKFKRR